MSWFLFLEAAFILVAFAIAATMLGRGTEELEKHAGQGVAGGVVLGLLNALPETVVVIVAMLHQSYTIAIGAALGGAVLIFTLGLGLISFVYFSRWETSIKMKGDYKVDFGFLLFGLAVLLFVLTYGRLDLLAGIALVAVYAGYVLYRYSTAKRASKDWKTVLKGKALWRTVGYLGVGGVIIVALSGQLVSVIEQLSAGVGVPTLWLSLLVVPIAGELPEILSGYRLARDGMGGASTAIVSYFGGKLVNITLLVGLIGIMSSVPISIAGIAPEFISVIFVSLFALLLLRDGKLNRTEGLALAIFYFVIMAFAYFA